MPALGPITNHASAVTHWCYNHFASGLDEVRGDFARFDLPDDPPFPAGLGSRTFPVSPIERLAVPRLEGDYHASTMDALNSLHDKLSPCGYAIIDDCGKTRWAAGAGRR